MLNFFSRLFNIRPQEWPQLLTLSGIFMSFIVGYTWGQIVIPVAFYVIIGVEALPYIFIGDALLVMLGTGVYSGFVDRMRGDRMMIALAGLGALGVAVGIGILQVGSQTLAYGFLYLLARLTADVISIHTGFYTNSLYDTRASKRIWPFIGAVIRVSMLIGGATIPLMNGLALPAEVIIGLWGLSMVGMIGATMLMNRFSTPPNENKSPAEAESYWQTLRGGFQYVAGSAYLKAMSLQVFLMMFLFMMLNFQAARIFKAVLEDQSSITNITSSILTIGSLLFLPFQLFLVGRLVARIGVGNLNLIYPALILGVTAGLVIFPEALPIAAAIYFILMILNVAFRAAADEMLYNAVPVHIKGRSRAFISGVVQPFGTLVAGLLSLPFLPIAQNQAVVFGLIGLGAVVYVWGAFMMRRRYGQALLELLEQESYSSLLSQTSADFRVDAATLKRLEDRLVESQDPDFVAFMASVMLDLGGKDAIPILERHARESSAEVAIGILETLAAADIRSEALIRLYSDFLADESPEVRKSALVGLEQAWGKTSKDYEQVAILMLDDEDLRIKAQVLPVLLKSGKMDYLGPANERLQALIQSPEPEVAILGVGVLGELGSARLFEFLDHPAERVRMAAALEIEELVLQQNPNKTFVMQTVARLPLLLNDSVERVRMMGINTVGRLSKDDPALLEKLIPCFGDSSWRIREAASGVFVQQGKASLNLLKPYSEKLNTEAGKLSAYTLARIRREDYAPQVLAAIRGNLRTIYQHFQELATLQTYERFPSIALMRDTLLERNDELVEEIFHLLDALYPAAALKTITTGLESENDRTRANAAEALEAMVSPQLAKLISLLYDPKAEMSQFLAVGQQEFGLSRPAPKNLMEDYLKSSETWHRVVMAFALGEMGGQLSRSETIESARQQRRQSTQAASPPKAPPPAAPPAEATAGRRTRSISSLFDRLGGDSKDKLPELPTAPRAVSDEADLERASTQIMRPLNLNDLPFNLNEIQVMLRFMGNEEAQEVKVALRAARRVMGGQKVTDTQEIIKGKEVRVLSAVEKVIFLKGVPFFQGMTVNQLKALSGATEEEFFSEDSAIFRQGDPGGTLYVVVSGKVGVERSNQAGTASSRVKDVDARGYFGETTLFDNSNCPTTALALRDTLCLKLRHEPFLALIQAYPDLSLQLIRVLSKQIQQTDEQVADLARRRSRTMHKVFDRLD